MTIEEFISTYGISIIQTILAAAIPAIAAWVAKIYKEHVDDETKRKVVATCVRAIQQLYKDLDGAAKYQKATEAISEMLALKGITITALEIQMLIEEVCYDFHASVVEAVPLETIELKELV